MPTDEERAELRERVEEARRRVEAHVRAAAEARERNEKGGPTMGGEMTMADLALVQAAVDEANGALARADAVIENAASALGGAGRCPAGCQGGDFGDCPGCRDVPVSAGNYEWNAEPEGRVYGGGGHGQDS